MSRVRMLVLALAVGAPLGARAVDAPHDNQGPNCSGCHLGHNAPGGGLTNEAGNFNLCQSCHLNPEFTGSFGFPWDANDQAVPGTRGRSHRWDADASNLGATPPSLASTDPAEKALAQHLDAGRIKCSTCHDVHQADNGAESGRGKQHLSTPKKTLAAGGSGAIDATSAPATLAPKAYVLQFTTGGAVGAARFQVSNDNRISWVQSNVLTAASVTLADGVVLAFTGSFAATEEYEFYVSYPYLRVDNTGSAMCVVCHKDRNMHWQDVEGRADGRLGTGIVLGTTVFSHPVGQPLNANARGYDRTTGILDANGATQATGDSNASNDLRLDGAGLVGCTSCHQPHNADSNSLTPD